MTHITWVWLKLVEFYREFFLFNLIGQQDLSIFVLKF